MSGFVDSHQHEQAVTEQVEPNGGSRTPSRCQHSISGKRQPMAAYRIGGLENTLLQPGESGLMSMIG